MAQAIERASLALEGRASRPSLVAVRSSAADEDGATASFAGAHRTELGLTVGQIPDAIRRCWASLWSPEAIAYRTARRAPFDGIAMAVVVQVLVPADAAAVVFTRHPVSGRRDQLVINAVQGLGEPMVAGTVTPDTIVVDRDSAAIVEFEPGTPGERLIAGSDGVRTASDGPDGPALDDDARTSLIRLAIEVEDGFGGPVDLEAAWHDDRWYLLQARPITTHREARLA